MNVFKKHLWMRKAGMFLMDIVLVCLSVYASMELRFEMQIPWLHANTMLRSMPLVVFVYMACYVLGGIYQVMWRYAGVRDVVRLTLLSAIACGITLTLNQFMGLGLFRGVLVFIGLLSTIAVGGSRILGRVFSKDRDHRRAGRRHAGNGCGCWRSRRLRRQYLQQESQTNGQTGASCG